MSLTLSYPGVYVQELQSQSHAITGVATSITAFIGFAARGIDQRAQMIFSFSDYQRLFGGLKPDSELGYAVQQFFANGGSQAVGRARATPGRRLCERQFLQPHLHRIEQGGMGER